MTYIVQSFISYVIVIILICVVVFELCISMLTKIENIKISISVSVAPVSGVKDLPCRKELIPELDLFSHNGNFSGSD